MEYIPNILGKVSLSGKSVSDLILFLVAAFTAIASLVMFFHWRRYGMGGATLALMEIVYVVVAVMLIVVAFLSLN
ncbi:MAG: hypothetical protein A2431_00195 [Candidatus Zambryskibacteria bacterium RIFOXYC1_FULL_39_10]|uniref:Uncharacterized protein n=1 Tax=Candidatus Zambryskibacteria bacterium RIFOXYC1_FULL_39_10 TaxID=1802779 RepID=A0A1G2UZE9_9BACT|nr:MAG: hypothetical protein A2431_00195 [Candidatus Zambryskibacteria bacterium RIFOXYC1_FULL_39_10]OHB15968.1 MAG: hypothetical protein A2605_03735 [Candidatus Zambryskibacteria bacterium RIFOXYD1_FULL_39_35]